MDLTLTVIRYRGQRPEHPVEIHFHERGGTVGRKSHNDLVLPDPERVVSSTHVRIEYQGGQYYLLDQSTNGTFLNHQPEPVEKGRPIPLSDGDVLSVGDYELRVSIEPGAEQGAVQDRDPAEPTATPAPPVGEPLDLLGGAPLDPLALVGGDAAGPAPTPHAEPAPSAEGIDLLAGLDLPAIEPNLQPDRGPPEQAAFVPPPMETATPPAVAPTEPGETTPPVPERAEGAAAPSAAGARMDDALADALLAAMGLERHAFSEAELRELITTVGRLLRVTVEGLMRVLATRADFKREMRLEMTTIRPVENNPLKFSVDATDALNRMLLAPRPGFLPPVEAVQEALDDILAHELAMLAGVRAALEALLDRLEPKTLEARFDSHASLSGVLPPLRKARYWSIFVDTYGQLRRDAEEGFLRLFGEVFVKAYEAQVHALKSKRTDGPG